MRERVLYVGLGCLAIVLVYVFQHVNMALLLFGWCWPGLEAHAHLVFVFNKTFRMVVNDLACLLIVWALFRERKYLSAALVVFAIELVVVLPLYFVIKLSLEGDSEISSPLLSLVHRLIVNPMLMLLLIIGFGLQRWRAAGRVL